MLINIFQRYYLWTFLILSGLAGLAFGNLAATLIDLQNESINSDIQIKQTNNLAPSPRKTLSTYQPIIAHNIFDPAARNRAPAQLSSSENVSRTASKWTLIGTVSGGELPLATLQDSKGIDTYQLDEELPDGGVLFSIERNRVKLRYAGGKVQVLELSEETLKTTPPPKRLQQGSFKTNLHVEEIGENRWQIPARLAEEARTNIGELLKQAQAIPYLEQNQTTGFQLKMLQPGSLLANIGLRKGDILRRINGLELNSPEKALQIFAQLRLAKQINIDLERKGKEMTFAYEIR